MYNVVPGAMFTLRGSAPDGLFAGNSGTNLLIFWQKKYRKNSLFQKKYNNFATVPANVAKR